MGNTISRISRKRFPVALATVVLTVSVSAVGVATAPAAEASPGAFISMLNGARTSAGLKPYAVNGGLSAVAQNWAAHQASVGKMSHNPSVAGQIPRGWRTYAENVGYTCPPSTSRLHKALMNSSGHRSNIMSNRLNSVGVGVAIDKKKNCMYVTQVFAWYAGASKPVPPKPAAQPARPKAVAPAPKAVAPKAQQQAQAAPKVTPEAAEKKATKPIDPQGMSKPLKPTPTPSTTSFTYPLTAMLGENEDAAIAKVPFHAATNSATPAGPLPMILASSILVLGGIGAYLANKRGMTPTHHKRE